MTRPNTQCLPSRKVAGAVVMKNWQPLVLGPELAWEVYQHRLVIGQWAQGRGREKGADAGGQG